LLLLPYLLSFQFVIPADKVGCELA